MEIQQAIDHVGFGRFQRRLFLVCGVTWAADAAEIFLISFALPGFRDEFGLSATEAGLVVTATFAGMLAGAWVWGAVADRVGRRLGFQLTIAIFAFAGLASAFAPDAVWLAVLRALTGFGLGGALPLDFSLFAEYLPTRNRGRWLVLLESFWAVGTVIAAVLGLLLVPTLGWRWLLATSAVAALLVLWVRLRVPESARYLLTRGRQDEARRLLDRIATENGTRLPPGELTVPEGSGRTGLGQLLRGGLRRTTLTLWALWLLIAFSYYGIFVWLPDIFAERYGYDLLNSYRYVFYLALIQLPGYFSAAWLVDRWGRKPVLATYLAASAVATLLWSLVAGVGPILATAGLMSFFTLGAWAALYAYTPEVYPTQLRAGGMGIASGFARIGGTVAPLLGGVLLSISLVAALSVFAVAFAGAALVALVFAGETRGRPLSDTLTQLSALAPGRTRNPRK
ncbi:putative MFS transporter [Prauserella shujinwangii]|uniref:Putative MFS transporter n=1 Tax=Prauserella shujinwangii TaxID=1453103 RepID=A0A2T0LKG8_9PSEU|nr:MFS transporter [Prauserella shujinwangii]PRX43384.1 putative MFS transporter [Prauserella shujinwangii]